MVLLLAAGLTGLVPSAGAATPPVVVSSSPDVTPSFNGPVRVVDYRHGIAYLGGDFTAALVGGVSHPRQHLAAVDATTGRLLPWRPAADGSVRALRVSRKWTYVGGDFRHMSGHRHARLARVSTHRAGAVDQRFRPRLSGEVRALAVYRHQLYVGGSFVKADRHVRKHLAAFHTRGGGTLVKSWRPETDGGVNVIKVANKRIYIAGGFPHLNGSARGRNVAAVGPVKGRLVKGFRSPVWYVVYDLEVTSSRIYAAADGPGGHVRALRLSGRSVWNLTLDGGTRAIALLDGALYVGGHFDNVCPTAKPGGKGGCPTTQVTRHKLAAVSEVDGSLLSWDPDPNSSAGTFAIDASTSPARVGAGGAWTALGPARQFSQSGFAQFQ